MTNVAIKLTMDMHKAQTDFCILDYEPVQQHAVPPA